MTRFSPMRLLLRTVFAAAALLATVGTGAFIDRLAHRYSLDGQQASAARALTVAAVPR